ncbi:MAG: UDP-N-acetylmuramoyl-tripeptide--D-alanyl-D-alanine ligase [Patescibacteria group bacterium]|nr:UDP-N-acetylmuramoyl-tripeptide--D-alanyl-D-alanine ligase [Patescibacteria group bacterium]
MMDQLVIIIVFLWIIIFSKSLFFWLWLWQLKEYHFGRFRAHFESQRVRKIISSFWRIKFPKATKKIIVISITGIFLEILVLFYAFSLENKNFYFLLLISLILAPIIFSLLVLVFQIPTWILRKIILKKAQKKIEKYKKLLVIGITGSYGKTSTKEFLAEILSQRFKVLKTAEHINAEIGIAKTILKELTQDYEIFIAEIGAYERGKIKEVCRILKPKIGILTGISEQHLSTFGSQENIIKAKFELIESLPEDGLAIFNGNNKYCQELYKRTVITKKITSSSDNTFQAIAKNLLPWDAENFLMASLSAEALGMNSKEIAGAAKKIKSQIEIKKGANGLYIIDSTYSANPNGLISHLEYLKSWGNPPSPRLPPSPFGLRRASRRARKIIVMPCLIELGKASKEIHQRIGEKIAEICDLAIITTKDYFKELKQGFRKVGFPEERILLIEKPKKIFEKIKSFSRPNDIILLESRLPQVLIKMLYGD